MPIEETTFSEEHLPSSWKEWIEENKIFLLTIGSLATLSLFLLFQTLFQNSQDLPSPPPPPQTHTVSTPKHNLSPKPKIPLSPLQMAKHLYQESKIEEAIRLLLHTASTHPEELLREEASGLAKQYHLIQAQKTQIQKCYLQGYVLFHTYPQEACQQWAKALMISVKEDPYYQKAQKRWKADCQNY